MSDEYSPAVRNLKVGDKIRRDHVGARNRVEHVRAIVDEEVVVVRWWRKRNGGYWEYKTEYKHGLQMFLDSKLITIENVK
jgi:hypothetical protein